MQRFLGRALSNLKSDFDKNKKLRDESMIVRLGQALDKEMPAEEMGAGLVKMLKDKKVKEEKPGTWLRAAKLYISIAEGTDAKNAAHQMGEIDFEDLKASLAEAAVDVLLSDEDFFVSVFLQATQSNPELWQRIEEARPDPHLIDVKVADAD